MIKMGLKGSMAYLTSALLDFLPAVIRTMTFKIIPTAKEIVSQANRFTFTFVLFSCNFWGEQMWDKP